LAESRRADREFATGDVDIRHTNRHQHVRSVMVSPPGIGERGTAHGSRGPSWRRDDGQVPTSATTVGPLPRLVSSELSLVRQPHCLGEIG
jgi:hypothetical protein